MGFAILLVADVWFRLLISQTIANPITGMAIWTLAAALLGFTTTLAITNARPINGILGLVSALVYIGLALDAGNPADAVLQFVYIILLDLPVILMPSWSENVATRVRKLKVKERGEKMTFAKTRTFFVLVFIISYIALYFFDVYVTHSPRPMIDAGAAAIGITGAVLTTLRFSEAYYMWFLHCPMPHWYCSSRTCCTWEMTIAFFASPWFKKSMRIADQTNYN